MSNIPPWFMQAVSLGSVKGDTNIPKWFNTGITESKNNMSEATKIWTGTVPIVGDGEEKTKETPDNSHVNINGDWPEIKPGAGYSPGRVKNWSYYYSPIVDRQWKGRSRRWGDADPEVLNRSRNLLIEQAKAKGLTVDDQALVLAIAHIESGFNPDAAAGPSSASGLGQFINKTGEAYGINDKTRWDISEQARALVEHYMTNKEMAKNKGQGLEYIYAYHHDGPSLAHGGLGLSRERVMPLYEKYKAVLSNSNESGRLNTDDNLPSVGDFKPTVNKSMNPLFTLDGSESHATHSTAEETMTNKILPRLSALEAEFGKKLVINDAIAKKGTSRETGRKKSRHFHGDALDISTRGLSDKEKIKLVELAKKHGFTGFGFGNTILHIDLGRNRYWSYGNTRFGGRSVDDLGAFVKS